MVIDKKLKSYYMHASDLQHIVSNFYTSQGNSYGYSLWKYKELSNSKAGIRKSDSVAESELESSFDEYDEIFNNYLGSVLEGIKIKYKPAVTKLLVDIQSFDLLRDLYSKEYVSGILNTFTEEFNKFYEECDKIISGDIIHSLGYTILTLEPMQLRIQLRKIPGITKADAESVIALRSKLVEQTRDNALLYEYLGITKSKYESIFKSKLAPLLQKVDLNNYLKLINKLWQN